MADSDGEYVELSDDDETAALPAGAAVNSNYGTRSKEVEAGGGRSKRKHDRRGGRAAWEDVKRSWEDVVETADGNITVAELLEAEKRRRLLRDTTPLQRGIIRHLILVIDMSFAMAEKDLLPNRYTLTLNYAVDFVREYFEQNPISQLGIIGMRDGVAVRVSDMSGNPTEHVERLRKWNVDKEPSGNPSLQNALEMCRGALFHAPSHGTREVLIIYGALLSSDPGDIHDTISSLIADRIRVSIVGLSAQVAICAELCSRTNSGDDGTYAIALHEQHFHELLLAATTPPVTLKGADPRDDPASNASLLMMGFPSRKLAARDDLALCACHNKPSREGYACTRCRAKVCRLPAECPACGLTLILSTHLARSYHHLFPLRNWVEVSWAEAARARSVACFSCQAPFPPLSVRASRSKGKGTGAGAGAGAGKPNAAGVIPAAETKGVSESGRYACQVCGNHFCIDCDVFAHEVLHNCPGCQSDTRNRHRPAQNGDAEMMGMEVDVVDAQGASGLNGNTVSHATDGMDIDTHKGPDGFLAPEVDGRLMDTATT